MLVLGVVVLVIGIVGAGALWFAANTRLDDNVAGLARAPSGCATTLDFDRTGEFTVFVETTGRLDDLAGDCAADTVYDRDDVANPEVVLVDPDGTEVDIEANDGGAYDSGGFSGSTIGVVQIAVAGDHVLTVPADGDQFVIAVGGDPNDGVAPLRWGAVLLLISALVIGGVVLVLGSRRSSGTEAADEPWQPGDLAAPSWPVGPPGFPAPPPTTGAVGPAGPPLIRPTGSSPGSPAGGSPWAPPSAPSSDQ
jgi:hypothetical protein